MSADCGICGEPKEATRVKSLLCRSCDIKHSSKGVKAIKIASASHTEPSRRLTTDLPPDVWERLDEEAYAAGKKIGPYLRSLIIARDAKKQAKVSGNAGD